MKNNSTSRNILIMATLFATTLTGMESLQAAPVSVSIAAVTPDQTNVVSTNNVAFKKRRTKKKRTGAMKKTGDAMQKPDAMGDNMKKPGGSGDARKK